LEGDWRDESPNFARVDAVDELESTEAIDGCAVSVAGLSSRPLVASDGYMTATLVDGEFIVPVNDQPIAARR
jgi:hypothetical protein